MSMQRESCWSEPLNWSRAPFACLTSTNDAVCVFRGLPPPKSRILRVVDIQLPIEFLSFFLAGDLEGQHPAPLAAIRVTRQANCPLILRATLLR